MEFVKNVFSVGILNPNLRVFDIIMATKYGTSYNAYLVRDPDGYVLIDTVHDSYSDIFFQNIQNVCNLQYIKYLIVNHCEPDHSGSIRKLLEINPDIEIYCTQASSIFLKEITNNHALKMHVVTNQQELKLADHVFKFYLAPFLHWPDTMFTYLTQEKLLFTCDFLGSHYCEPTMDDHSIVYPKAYDEAFLKYFNGIFGPFKNYVLKGCEIIKSINPKIVAPSHGPILHDKCQLPIAIEKYEKWASVSINPKAFPIFYVSAYHNTEMMAKEIFTQAIKNHYEPQLYDVINYPIDELANILNNCNQFAIGSPTINRNALPPIWNLLSYLDAINMKGKKCLLFGSYGWSGEACDLLMKYLANLGINVYPQILKFRFRPNKNDLDQIKNVMINFIK